MNQPPNTLPFDSAKALNGHPLIRRDGKPIIEIKRRNVCSSPTVLTDYIYEVTVGGKNPEESAGRYTITKRGTYYKSRGEHYADVFLVDTSAKVAEPASGDSVDLPDQPQQDDHHTVEPVPSDPGEGYRFVAPDERLQPGDEMWSVPVFHGKGESYWKLSVRAERQSRPQAGDRYTYRRKIESAKTTELPITCGSAPWNHDEIAMQRSRAESHNAPEKDKETGTPVVTAEQPIPFVGEGYRWLHPSEVLMEGDEYRTDILGDPEWLPTKNIGRTAADVQGKIAEFRYRRKVTQGEVGQTVPETVRAVLRECERCGCQWKEVFGGVVISCPTCGAGGSFRSTLSIYSTIAKGSTFEIVKTGGMPRCLPGGNEVYNDPEHIDTVVRLKRKWGAGSPAKDSLLTEAEHEVMRHLTAAWNAYTELESIHPDDDLEFRLAIHGAQRQIMARPAQREFNNNLEKTEA